MSAQDFFTRQLLEAKAPGIRTAPLLVRANTAMREALRAVDRDIEVQGAVSCETVEACRAALALANT